MRLLAIETSCDETAISIVEANESPSGTDFAVLGNVTHSQIDVHREYGGVFPAMGKREHQRNLVPILLGMIGTVTDENRTGQDGRTAVETDDARAYLDALLAKEPELLAQVKDHLVGLPRPAIDRICVTSGPGLEPALWVGINFAKALGYLWGVPVVPVNHMEGHVLSVLVPALPGAVSRFTLPKGSLALPALALLISGGHTELVLVRAVGDYEIVGRTRDDAVGEAFDKVARILGLPYPGGPEVSRLAAEARRRGLPRTISLPRPMIGSGDFDFSFSGIKTAVLYATKDREDKPRITEAVGLPEETRLGIAREFEDAVAEVLARKTERAIARFGARTLIVGGGVAANARITDGLRDMLARRFPEVALMTPAQGLSTDNSLMIALAGYFKIKRNPNAVYDDIRADGNWSLS